MLLVGTSVYCGKCSVGVVWRVLCSSAVITVAIFNTDKTAEFANLYKQLKNCPKPLHLPRTVNGTGHTGPSEFCATSI